jgi:GTP-binding protein
VKFVDSCDVDVIAGKGGNGAIAFRREKYVPFGGPSGGDGGKGGDVVFVADAGLSTLADLTYARTLRAANGEQGHGKDMYGRGADDLVVRVPVGTQVFDRETGALLYDIDRPGLRVVVAKGGKGGRGNIHFATPYDRAPRRAETGEAGEEKKLRLELKVMADVGLLGFPNVGKSTFIRAVSRARPKVADYPFTTLTPHLGVVRIGEEASMVIADIPGLIPGAAEGAGLGHRFLKHVERTRALLHLVTLDYADGRDPLSDYDALMTELERFDPELAKRPQLVAMTKADLPEVREAFPSVQARFAERGIRIRLISAVTGEGVRDLTIDLYKLVTGRSEIENWERPAPPPARPAAPQAASPPTAPDPPPAAERTPEEKKPATEVNAGPMEPAAKTTQAKKKPTKTSRKPKSRAKAKTKAAAKSKTKAKAAAKTKTKAKPTAKVKTKPKKANAKKTPTRRPSTKRPAAKPAKRRA